MGNEYQNKKKDKKDEEIRELKKELEDMKVNMTYLMAAKFSQNYEREEEEAAIHESPIILSKGEERIIFPSRYEKDKEN